MLAAVLVTTVKIGVFGLFHPAELEVQPARGSVIVVESDGRKQVLEGAQTAMLKSAAKVTGRDGAEARFILSVPGKIRREFRGRLEVRMQDGSLVPIVEMDRETAVGAIVAAEAPGSPREAQKAQAVLARSFLAAARGRHQGFDFCDTTHCQYLREAARPGTVAARAQRETHGLALAYQGHVIAALYSGNCGGHTRTLEDAGWNVEGYPYFAVECPARGPVSGHRIGLCQTGAVHMARTGSNFIAILSHYFPAAVIVNLEGEQ